MFSKYIGKKYKVKKLDPEYSSSRYSKYLNKIGICNATFYGRSCEDGLYLVFEDGRRIPFFISELEDYNFIINIMDL